MLRFPSSIVLLALAFNSTASAVLVSRWQGEGNALDGVGSNNGTVIGTVQYTSGPLGQAFLFPDNGYIRVPNPGAGGLVSPNAFSVATWVRADSADPPPDGGPGALINFGTSANTNGFVLAQGGTTSMMFGVWTSATPNQTNILVSQLPFWNVGQTYHIAATFDGATHTMSIYRDGVLAESRSDVQGTGMLVDPTATFDIGRSTPLGSTFEGMLDDVRFYNHALSANEVAALVPEPSILSLAAAAAAGMVSRRRARRARQRKPASCEPLEDRKLLAIVWTNRGTNDNFSAAFPGQEAAARTVVDQAIAEWNRIITNFNQVNGANNYNLQMFVESVGGSIARGGPISHDGERVPDQGQIRLDPTAAGNGWYIDPEPRDDAEFGTLNSPFCRTSTSVTACDLYATVLHELGHCMGIISNPTYLLSDFLTNTNVDDPNTATAGNLLSYTFQGSTQATFTQADPGHLFEGPAVSGHPEILFHPFDLMNPGRALPNNQRNLITDTTVRILQQVYQYSVVMPSTLNNAMVNPDYTARTLRISGQPGSVDDTIILQGTGVAGQLHVTVGPFTEIIPWPQMDRIIVDAGAGNDIIRTEFNASRPTTLNGGDGADAFDFSFSARNLDNIQGECTVNGGIGADSIFVYDGANGGSAETYTVTSNSIDRSFFGGVFYGTDVSVATLVTAATADTVFVLSCSSSTNLIINSAGGLDTVNINRPGFGLNEIAGFVDIQNNPDFTFLNINDTGNATARVLTVDFGSGNNGRLLGVGSGAVTWDNADIQQITITTGGGFDTLNVQQCSERLLLLNSGGEDDIAIGNNTTGLSQVTGGVDIGPNANQQLFTAILTLNDIASSTGRNYSLTPTAANAYSVAGLPFLFNFVNTLFLLVKGGSGNDSLTLHGVSQYVDFDGGIGADTLNVDDRTSTKSLATATISNDRFLRVTNDVIPQSVTTKYANVETPVFRLRDSCTALGITGTPASIGAGQMSVFGGLNGDAVTISPVDGAGNRTVNGTLYLDTGNGFDTLDVSAVGTTRDMAYVITHLSGPTILHVTGLGTALFGESGIDAVTFNAGDGTDTFAVEKLTGGAGIQINGGGGNDTCTIGNGDMSANLTSAASFGFNGQTGTDDRFTIDNTTAAVTWNYEIDNGFIWASRPSTGYGWTSNITNLESQHINGGVGTDVFYIDAVASGVQTNCNGLGGTDSVLIGVSANPDDVRGPVNFDAGASGGILRMFDGADTTGDVVHLTASTLGKHAGDTLFGPGGSLTFNGLMDSGGNNGVEINLGSGADTVYAQPLPNARVIVAGNNPGTVPGDRINLALAGVQNPVVTHGSTGSVTSANRQTLSWTGMEQSTQPIDDVAPAPVKIQFKNGNGGRARLAVGSAIDVQFSEDVSGLLNPSFLTLQNLTTSATVPASNIAVAWNAATLTATFTFPGYPGGVIPNGSYQAQLLAGLVDPFGNPTAASNFYKFVWVAGTGGNDTFRIARAANFSDFNVFFNNDVTPAFVGGDDIAQIALAGDSGDDSLVVDCTNLNPTPTIDGITFDGGDGADSIKARGSANVDGFTFLAGSIMPGATTILHPNVETQLYDGAGGFDSLGVYGTTVILPVSQRFATIDLNQSGKLVMQSSLDGVLVTRALTIAAGSTIDLDDSDLIVDYTGASQLAQVQALINTARSGGTWNGATGITSTAAKNANPRHRTLGAMEATDFKSIYGASAAFDGEPIDNSAVLVKYTYYGDADFSGAVNFDDYSRTDAGFNFTRTGWLNGDFDGNGVVNFDDYSLIDLAFNTQ